MWGNINELYKFSKVSDSNALRALIIMPVPWAIFREIHLICSIQFNLLSIVIPKNLALSTSWILDPFIWMVGQFSFLPLGLNIIKLVLSIFRDSLLAFNHYINFLNSLLTTVASSCKLFELKNNVVSSANKMENRLDTEAISFMYSNGPRIDPCGTPHVISFISEEVLL